MEGAHAALLPHLFLLLVAVAIACGELIYPAQESRPNNNRDDIIPLYIGLIQSYDPSMQDAQIDTIGLVVGTEIALDHINANESILPGYRLHYNFAGAMCDGRDAVEAFFHQVFNAPTKVGIIGAGCSPSTQTAALVSQFYNLTQISCAASSPVLADRKTYTRYFQLVPPEFESAHGFYSLIQWYKWKRVGVIVEEEDIFEKTFFKLRDLVDGDAELPSYKFSFDNLNESVQSRVFDWDNFDGVRIFIILSYQSVAVPLLCEAYKRNLMYPRYHFLLLGWYSNEWWKKTATRCSLKEIEQALQHSLSADLLPDARVLGDDWQSDVGINNGEFYEAERNHIENPSPPLNLTVTNYLSQYCYDATWAFALVLNKTIEDLKTNTTLNEMARDACAGCNMSEPFGIQQFDYGNTVVLERMMDNWNNLKFTGITGKISFENGLGVLTRIRITQFMYNDDGVLEERDVGHLMRTSNFTLGDVVDSIEWADGVPYDGEEGEVTDTVKVGYSVFLTILGLLGIVFAIFCLVFNFVMRSKLIIRLSSPELNYMIGGGAILLYIAVILIVHPVANENITNTSVLCILTPWFISIGYSLCYGTIVVKMFRTWYIFNDPFANKTKMKNWKLAAIVFVMVAVDVVILVIYTAVECGINGVATRVENKENPVTVSGPQQVSTRHFVYQCTSNERKVALGILYGYKAILQFFSLLMSFATWNVKVKGLDDAKAITLCTYVTSLVLTVVIVSTYTLSDFINAYAVVLGIGFFLGTTIILALVFMIKLFHLAKDPTGDTVFSTNSAGNGEQKSFNSKFGSEMETLKKRIKELEGTSTSPKIEGDITLDINGQDK